MKPWQVVPKAVRLRKVIWSWRSGSGEERTKSINNAAVPSWITGSKPSRKSSVKQRSLRKTAALLLVVPESRAGRRAGT